MTVKKTAKMELAEIRFCKDITDLLIDGYSEFHAWAPVAKRLGISRQTLMYWKLRLGIGEGYTETKGGQLLPIATPKPCIGKPGWLHCPYCGACNGPASTACGGCSGDFKQEGETNG